MHNANMAINIAQSSFLPFDQLHKQQLDNVGRIRVTMYHLIRDLIPFFGAFHKLFFNSYLFCWERRETREGSEFSSDPYDVVTLRKERCANIRRQEMATTTRCPWQGRTRYCALVPSRSRAGGGCQQRARRFYDDVNQGRLCQDRKLATFVLFSREVVYLLTDMSRYWWVPAFIQVHWQKIVLCLLKRLFLAGSCSFNYSC